MLHRRSLARRILLIVAVLGVSTGLLLCATSSVVGVALFVRTRPGVPVETRAWEFTQAVTRPAPMVGRG